MRLPCLLLLPLLTASIHVTFLFSVVYREDITVHRALIRGLLSNGDNVTMVAPLSYDKFNSLDFPSGTHFSPLEHLADLQKSVLTEKHTERFYDVMNYVTESCTEFYKEPLIARLIEQGQTEWDVVIVDSTYNECVLPLVQYTHTIFILLSTSNRIPAYVKYSLAIPDHPSYSPDHWSLNDNLSFTKRMKAFFNYKKMLNIMDFWYYRSINKAASLHIPSHETLLSTIQRTSLTLYDANIAIDLPLPTFNNVIPIGGIQCEVRDPDNLPPKIRDFISEAQWGTIFVSFGTVFRSSNLPYASLTKLVSVFGKVKQRVLWVVDNTNTEVIKLSSNVMPVEYVNQQEVLSHPNVVLFISHMGHFSRQEAIFHRAPIIAFPLFDPVQYANSDYIHSKKIGVKFDINAFSEEMLLNGIMEVITNPKFEENIGRLSDRMKDSLVSPIATAVYWIHYAVRNKGASYLRSHSMLLYWFQYYLVDVTIFVTISTLLVAYVIIGIAKWCRKRYLLQLEINKKLQLAKVSDSRKYMNALKED